MSESTFRPSGDTIDALPPPAAAGAPGRGDGLRSPSRVEALSDGVFAIILTLLVLEIAVPKDLSGQSLRQVIEELRPTMVAWVISFLIAGMYWVSHRDLFARIRVVNRDLVWLNLLFLLPASLIPFGRGLTLFASGPAPGRGRRSSPEGATGWRLRTSYRSARPPEGAPSARRPSRPFGAMACGAAR